MNKDLRAKIESKAAEAVQNLADAMLEEALTDPMRAEMSARYHMGEPDVFHTLQIPPGKESTKSLLTSLFDKV